MPRVIHLVIVDNDGGGYDHVVGDDCGDVDDDDHVDKDDDKVKANPQARAG